MKNIAIIFDIDDTLYDQRQPFENALRSVLNEDYLSDIKKMYSDFLKRGSEVFAASESGEMSLRDSRIYRITRSMKDQGIIFDESMAELFQKEYEKNQGILSMTEAMERILQLCKENAKVLGVISNGPGEHQLKKIKILGADKWIPETHVVISGSAGFAKPDERIFRLSEERCALSDMEIYMIGDSWENDIEGAKKAGWKTIWFNRHEKPLPDNYKIADYIIYTEEELERILWTIFDI